MINKKGIYTSQYELQFAVSATKEEELTIVPTYGELELMASTVAIVNENSVNWFDGGVEYYVVSDVMSTTELLDVVRSISVLPVSK